MQYLQSRSPYICQRKKRRISSLQRNAGSARKNLTIKNPKVRDHCHILGLYRGPAHKTCNTKLVIKPWITPIPIVFHNLKGYDSHLIMQQIHKITGRLSCIPNNTEKYIYFSVGQLKFLDSFQFMASSLAKLVDATDKDDFKITRNSFNPQPIKKRLYGSLGSEDCRPMILREGIDKHKLAYILEHHNQFELGTNFRDGQKSYKRHPAELVADLSFHAEPKWKTAYVIQATQWIRPLLDSRSVWYPNHEPEDPSYNMQG